MRISVNWFEQRVSVFRLHPTRRDAALPSGAQRGGKIQGQPTGPSEVTLRTSDSTVAGGRFGR
jgi:hypothetical protein